MDASKVQSLVDGIVKAALPEPHVEVSGSPDDPTALLVTVKLRFLSEEQLRVAVVNIMNEIFL